MEEHRITLADGSGGKRSAALVEAVFMKQYGNAALNSLDDAAEISCDQKRLAFTTDGYTVKPIFFPGGDIGKLAVCGTINDLVAKGAHPLALSASFILEEGFLISDLERIVSSMSKAAESVPVSIVTGDTKVVRKKEADGIFITTSGIGGIRDPLEISCSKVQVGDDIIISGTIAEHGLAVLNAREQLDFDPHIQSDVQSLFPLLEVIGPYARHIHVMRDPTRGGVASVLNEIAKASKVTMTVFEDTVPLRDDVRGCCSLLGLDPLYIANEGKMIIISNASVTEKIMRDLRKHPLFGRSEHIGRVDTLPYQDGIPAVSCLTALGSKRYLPLLEGDPLPRIC